MPTANETRVRVEGLSKITATARGPASGWQAEPVGLQRGRRGRGPRPARSGLRSSSRRKCRVMGRPLRRGGRRGRVAASRIAGSAARNASACVVGEDQRRREPDDVRRDGVDEEPGARGAAASTAAATGAVSTMPSSSPAPRTVADQRVAERAMPSRSRLAQRLGAARAGRRARWCRARRAPRRRRPGCRRRWCRAGRAEQRRAARRTRRRRRSAARRRGPWPASRRRARRPARWWANQRAGAADAGLHLVEHEQRAGCAR